MNGPHASHPGQYFHRLHRRKPTPNPSPNPSAIVVMGCLPNKSSTGSITLSATSTMGDGLSLPSVDATFSMLARMRLTRLFGCFY